MADIMTMSRITRVWLNQYHRHCDMVTSGQNEIRLTKFGEVRRGGAMSFVRRDGSR